MVENLLSSRIKTIHIDNGGEFVNHAFPSFLIAFGISRQLTCPYTSEQNGVVERKHRHIVSMGRCLQYQAGVPNSY